MPRAERAAAPNTPSRQGPTSFRRGRVGTGHLAGVARVAPQRFRGRVDAHDVGARGFGLATPRQDEVAIVRPRALEIVNHQIATMRLDRRLEALDRREQVGELVRLFRTGERDPSVAQPVGDFRCYVAALAHDCWCASTNHSHLSTPREISVSMSALPESSSSSISAIVMRAARPNALSASDSAATCSGPLAIPIG